MYKLLNKRVMPYMVGVGIGLSVLFNNVYGEKADDGFGNFLAGTVGQLVLAPAKVLHHTFTKGPKGTFYGVADSVENLGKAVVGEEISMPEELGDISSAFNKSPGGRIVASAAGGAILGAAAGIAGASVNITHDVLSTGELAGVVAGTTATVQGLEETLKAD